VTSQEELRETTSMGGTTENKGQSILIAYRTGRSVVAAARGVLMSPVPAADRIIRPMGRTTRGSPPEVPHPAVSFQARRGTTPAEPKGMGEATGPVDPTQVKRSAFLVSRSTLTMPLPQQPAAQTVTGP
jgi:hypothetical protein